MKRGRSPDGRGAGSAGVPPALQHPRERAGETPALPGSLHPGYQPLCGEQIAKCRRGLNDKER